MEYKVIYSKDRQFNTCLENIEHQVNELLREGWKPIGGVSILNTECGYPHMYVISQAVIKE